MNQRPIASLSVSEVGLGCNNFGRRLDPAQSAAVVNAALDTGVNFFDTADIYGQGKSEEFLGRALGVRRDAVVIATKLGGVMEGRGKGASPAYIRQAVEASLRRLGTDRIDLYQLHYPDPDVPIEDTLGALGDLVKAGKVREIGCSNFSVGQLREAATVPGKAARFASVQNEYSLLHREPEGGVLDECERQGLAFLPYFPLMSGLLTGKYRRGQPAPEGSRLAEGGGLESVLSDRNLAVVEELIRFAEARGRTILELAVSWLLERPAVASVISGATSPRQVKANVHAAGWRLGEEELAEIDAITMQVESRR
jgi:aryl-alcohol dehydrogenase-like predicted oxidoreductase